MTIKKGWIEIKADTWTTADIAFHYKVNASILARAIKFFDGFPKPTKIKMAKCYDQEAVKAWFEGKDPKELVAWGERQSKLKRKAA